MWQFLIPALGSLASTYFASSSANKQQKQQTELQRQQMAQNAQNDAARLALEESTLDPWRSSMFQANNLAALDKLERSKSSPVQMSLPSRYAQYAPSFSGGFSYEKSPEMLAAIAELKKQMLAGQGRTPSTTTPKPVGVSAVRRVDPELV